MPACGRSTTPRRGGGFVFASALEAVLAAPDVGRELDEFTVGMHLMGRDSSIPVARTFFDAVRRLPPGHGLVVTNGAARLQRHWRPEDAPRAAPASDDDCAEEFLALYSRAVKDRLCGSGRMGVHLSGGPGLFERRGPRGPRIAAPGP